MNICIIMGIPINNNYGKINTKKIIPITGILL